MTGIAHALDMALLAPFRNYEAIFPETLVQRLKSFTMLEDIGDQALRRILAESDWFGIPGGTQLARDGENDRAVFLVVTGSLGVFVHEEGASKRLVATIPAGETVGEMSLLTGESHSATLVALRDTELLRLGPKAFEMLLTRYPRVMLNLLKVVVRRLRETTRGAQQRTRPKTFAVIPLQRDLKDMTVPRSICAALVEMGAKAAVLDNSVADQATEWFNRFEAEHDVVFYQGDQPDSTWTQFCLRQADRVLLLARAGRQHAAASLRTALFQARDGCAAGIVVGASRRCLLARCAAARRSKARSFRHPSSCARGNNGDMKRLARFIAGCSVNIVLAGGGARGFAHIGVLKALKEAGVPFDYVAGTSMGRCRRGGIAMEWDIDELKERVHDAFVVNKPLSDYTIPLIALFRGARVSALLQKHFGDMRIEDLPKPYFCVSSDLTSGRDYVHRSGLLWRALRASVALPGIMPPVTTESGHLLVDGGVMNNLPVDVMAAEARGPIVAVDVSGEIDLRADDDRYGERSIWSLIGQRMRGSPSIISILMRAGTVGSDLQRRSVREQADFLFEPPLDGVGHARLEVLRTRDCARLCVCAAGNRAARRAAVRFLGGRTCTLHDAGSFARLVVQDSSLGLLARGR
jgi:NTE family protein